MSISATVISAVVNVRLIGAISEIEDVIIAIRPRCGGHGSRRRRSGRRRCSRSRRRVHHRVKIIVTVIIVKRIHSRGAVATVAVVRRIIVVVRAVRSGRIASGVIIVIIRDGLRWLIAGIRLLSAPIGIPSYHKTFEFYIFNDNCFEFQSLWRVFKFIQNAYRIIIAACLIFYTVWVVLLREWLLVSAVSESQS